MGKGWISIKTVMHGNIARQQQYSSVATSNDLTGSGVTHLQHSAARQHGFHAAEIQIS